VIDLLAPVADVLQIAHDLAYPHQESADQAGGSGGGASVIVILAGVVASLGAVGGLVWLKKRADTSAADTELPGRVDDGGA
jgi:hypothetical protein